MTKKIVIILSIMLIIFNSYTVFAEFNSETEKKIKNIEKALKDGDSASVSVLVGWYKTVFVAHVNAMGMVDKDNIKRTQDIMSKLEDYVENKVDEKDIKKYVKEKVTVYEYDEFNNGKRTEKIDPTKLKSIPEGLLRAFWRSALRADDKKTSKYIQQVVDPKGENSEEEVPELTNPIGDNLEDRAEYAINMNTINSNRISEVASPIITIVSNFGIIISVIALMVIGIKYMLGSAEERADYKKTLFPYFIGAVLLFSGSTIPQIIYKAIK